MSEVMPCMSAIKRVETYPGGKRSLQLQHADPAQQVQIPDRVYP
jgi:hypothetical protein